MKTQSKYLAPGSEATYAALRMVAGSTFAFSGLMKIFGVMSDFQAAFLSSGTMAVAYTQFHWKFEFGEKFFPAINQGGPALLYTFLFRYIACKGSGIASVDSLLGRPGKSGH